MIKGEEDVFLVGEVNFFEVRFPRVVVIEGSSNLYFYLILRNGSGSFEPFVLDFVLLGGFGIRCAHFFIIKINLSIYFLFILYLYIYFPYFIYFHFSSLNISTCLIK